MGNHGANHTQNITGDSLPWVCDMENKQYTSAEPVTITLTMEQWELIRHWLQYGTDYHKAKRAEWLAVCNDPKLGAAKAAEHEKAAAEAETLRKIIEAAILEDSTNGTTES